MPRSPRSGCTIAPRPNGSPLAGDVYAGTDGALTGAARLAQEAEETAAQLLRQQAIERSQRDLERKRAALKAQIAALQLEFSAQEAETLALVEPLQAQERQRKQARVDMAGSRQADPQTNTEDQP